MTIMKINSTAERETMVSGNTSKERLEKNQEKEQQDKTKDKSINASELNLIQDPIAEKRQKAMQDAMDFIKKQFESDGKVDETLGEFRDQIATGKENGQEASRELQAIREQKEKLKEEYPDENDEDYKAYLKDLNEREGHWKGELNAANKMISDSTKAIKAIKQEALKHHGMVDAVKAAEETMAAASKEVIGMLVDEAKDQVDEKLDETVDKADKTEEEEKEKEEALKESQAEREKQAQDIEEQQRKNQQRAAVAAAEPIDVRDILDKQQDILQNTQQILEEQSLLPEEIKGIVVDFNI